jgi:molecular chaperone GrpE
MFLSTRYAYVSLLVVVVRATSLTLSEAFTVPTSLRNTPTSFVATSTTTTTLFLGDSATDNGSEETPSSEPSTSDNVTNEVSEPQEEVSNLQSAATSGMDILNSPQFLARKRDVLMNDIQKIQNDIIYAKERLQQNKDEWGGQIADLQKEYEMIQQRMNVQSNTSNDAATSQVVRSMLAVLDNFDRAFNQVTAQTEEEKVIENEYKQVYHSILDIFKKLGVQEVPTVGIEFNYEIHQAVLQKPSEEYSEGIVCEELQKGFQINNTLIRAAMVAVAI